jgi:hypothetical protein
MPRVIVTTETSDSRERSILLSEHVEPAHMHDEHSSLQFLERLAWAIQDAERAEQCVAVDARYDVALGESRN